MGLFEKLDTIEISVLDNLGIEDKAKVKYFEQRFNEKMRYFSEMLKDLNEMLKKFEEMPCIGRENDFVHQYAKPTNLISDAIEKLNKNIQGTKDSFVYNLIAYFEEKYNFDIQGYKTSYELKAKVNKLKENPNVNEMVGLVLSMSGGISLSDMAIKNVKDVFVTKAKRVKSEVKGAAVNISDFFWITRGYNGSYRIDSDNSMQLFKNLLKCISLFEFNSIENKTGLQVPNYSSWDFDIDSNIILRECKKVEYLKIYKNGKIGIYFYEKADASNFYHFFDLNN